MNFLRVVMNCWKNTRGYKIAGVATLAATAGGVVGNIALHKKIQEGASGGGGGGSNVKTDTQSQAERDESSCNEFLKLGIPLPPECNG